LNYLFHNVSSGGIVIFDDFVAIDNEDRFPGARLATKEFLGKEYDNLQLSVAGNYYYIKK
jgi:hypothetical protein